MAFTNAGYNMNTLLVLNNSELRPFWVSMEQCEHPSGSEQMRWTHWQSAHYALLPHFPTQWPSFVFTSQWTVKRNGHFYWQKSFWGMALWIYIVDVWGREIRLISSTEEKYKTTKVMKQERKSGYWKNISQKKINRDFYGSWEKVWEIYLS